MVNYKQSLSVWYFPSSVLVNMEYVIIENLGCPSCKSKDISFVKQEMILSEDQNTKSFPVGGDKLIYVCNNCGADIEYRFDFKNAKSDEKIEDFLRETLKIMLDTFASSKTPDFKGFNYSLNELLRSIATDDRVHNLGLTEKFKNIWQEEIKLRLSERMKGFLDGQTQKELLLLIKTSFK